LVALPTGLANAGHEAMLAAPHRFEGFVRDQVVPFAGVDDCWSFAAGPGAGADILVHNGQVVVGQHLAEKLGIPAVLALPIPMYVPTRAFPWAGIAIPRWWPSALNRATLLGVKGPAMMFGRTVDRWRDVGPARCDAVAGMIRAAAPTAHRRRCCTRSADMCCQDRRLAGCSHGARLLVPGRHRARAITSPPRPEGSMTHVQRTSARHH
jgi:hypothetical protein